MGRSAKLHKRAKRPAGANIAFSTSSSSTKTLHRDNDPSTTTTLPAVTRQLSAQDEVSSAKKKAGLKAKVRAKVKAKTKPVSGEPSLPSSSGTTTEYVLGGADYVELMMGSRKRAREEAAKLPTDSDG